MTKIQNQANGQDVFVAQGSTGIVINGDAGDGIGVWGSAAGGIGVRASSDTGVGLQVDEGRIRIDQVAGVATIAAGARQATVSPGVDVNPRSFVLLSPKSNLGARSLWYSTNASANTFTIRMSSSRGRATKVAWLLVEHG